ncbi:MAG: glucose-1-phosphate adenylyltransferase subunit GlgD [Candidatus Coproplasma sp.]
MTSTVGVIFSSINDEHVSELTRVRSKGSIPFGGRYRLVDFTLSNMVNSGITTVGLLTKNNYQSLMDHLGSGKEWDLARKEGGLILLPPYSDESEVLYRNRLEALKGATAFLKKAKEDFVVIADSDSVYKLDYSKVIEQHIAHNANLTLVYHEHECTDEKSYMMFNCDDDEKITSVDVNVKGEGVRKHYINVLVARTTYLLSILQKALARGLTSFSKDLIIPAVEDGSIYGYKLEGYYSNIDSLSSYYRSNMDLLDKKVRNEIFGDRDVYTKVNDAPPAKITEDAHVVNSLIHDGCLIEGTVENCILFRNVHVGKGAHLKNCIIMSENDIAENCNLAYVVSDKDSSIGKGVTLAGCEQKPYFINKGSRI